MNREVIEGFVIGAMVALIVFLVHITVIELGNANIIPEKRDVIVLDKWWESEALIIGFEYQPSYMTGGERIFERDGRVSSDILCHERDRGTEVPVAIPRCDPALLHPGIRDYEYWYPEQRTTYIVVVGSEDERLEFDATGLTTTEELWKQLELHEFYRIVIDGNEITEIRPID